MKDGPEGVGTPSEDEVATILRTLGALTEPLAAIIPGECEVVLHDLRLLPNSIVAIAGDLTGRTVGSPATDMLLRASARGAYESAIGYPSRHSDGREMLSSTLIIRDSADVAVAALCINADTSVWRVVHHLASAMLPDWPTPDAPSTRLRTPHSPGDVGEEFPSDVDDLAESLLAGALADAKVPVDLMHKRHKLSVVSDLKDRGFFLLKGSAETAAAALGITRFTIYNYLREIEHNTADETPAD